MREWINGLVGDRYKTDGALAKAIGMTESGFSRAAKAGTFDVENCLRLAKETGASASEVLALAGKGEVHALIESLYGHAQPPTDAEATKIAALFSQVVDREARAGFAMMLRGYVKAQAASAAPAPAKPKSRQR